MIMIFFYTAIAAGVWWSWRYKPRNWVRRAVIFSIYSIMAVLDTEWSRPDYWIAFGLLYVAVDYVLVKKVSEGGEYVR